MHDFHYVHLLLVMKPPFESQIPSLILVHCPLKTKFQSDTNTTYRELVLPNQRKLNFTWLTGKKL